jgi:SepF-like predicted cell division protein (DUF552 family)
MFRKLKRALSKEDKEMGEEYIEIDLEKEKTEQKVAVKLFNLKNYEEVNDILNALREGLTIVMVDIKTLRQKDSIELKRAISKIKKTVDALEGNIAGFGENLVVATPAFAKIQKHVVPEKKKSKFED